MIEAKEDKSYTVRMALAEIEKARQNRCAQLDIFVFSSATVPDGTEMLKRYGNDIVVVWDQDDPASDIRLKCAVSMARALVIRERQASAATEANFDEIDSAVDLLSKDATLLTEVTTWANTVQSNGKKIADRIEKVRDDLEKQIEMLEAITHKQEITLLLCAADFTVRLMLHSGHVRFRFNDLADQPFC